MGVLLWGPELRNPMIGFMLGAPDLETLIFVAHVYTPVPYNNAKANQHMYLCTCVCVSRHIHVYVVV